MANTVPGTSDQKPTLPPTEPRIQIKDADPFQAVVSGILNAIENNAKLVAALFVVAIIAGIGWIAMEGVQKRQERSAQEAYFTVESKYAKVKEGFERAKFRAFMPADSKEDPGTPASGDLTKDYGTLIADLEKVATEHAGTTASGQAALLAAETYLAYKQPDKAMELAQIPAEKLSKNHTLSHLGKLMWGNALASKDDCQGAVSQWQKVLDQPSAEYLYADVSLRAGLCLEKMGQTDRAIEMYRKASSADPSSAAAQSAKGFLRALEVKAQAPATNG